MCKGRERRLGKGRDEKGKCWERGEKEGKVKYFVRKGKDRKGEY